jgi:type II secretory pathway pseudopilin PulG
MTLIELTVALCVLAVATGCLIQVLVALNAGRERLWKKQQALDAAKQTAEAMIAFDGESDELYDAYHDPPRVIVQDGDGDLTFDSGWARVTIRETVPSVAGEAEEEVKLVFGKAETGE